MCAYGVVNVPTVTVGGLLERFGVEAVSTFSGLRVDDLRVDDCGVRSPVERRSGGGVKRTCRYVSYAILAVPRRRPRAVAAGDPRRPSGRPKASDGCPPLSGAQAPFLSQTFGTPVCPQNRLILSSFRWFRCGRPAARRGPGARTRVPNDPLYGTIPWPHATLSHSTTSGRGYNTSSRFSQTISSTRSYLSAH